MQKFRSILITTIKRLALGYLLICLMMFTFQRRLLYMPNTDVKPPATYGLTTAQDLTITGRDGTPLQAWYLPAKNNFPTILYFHGNAGNLSNRHHYFQLLNDAGFGVFGLSFRGYGNSGGAPSEQGFYDDARAAVNYAIHTLHLPIKQLLFYGESIGTGVAVQMGTEFSVGAVILQSPYTSIYDVAKDSYWWIPVDLLLRDRFDSYSKIENLHSPLLLFHGEEDTIIPITLAKQLFEKALAPKTAIYIPYKGHINFNFQVLTQHLLDFSLQHHLIQSP